MRCPLSPRKTANEVIVNLRLLLDEISNIKNNNKALIKIKRVFFAFETLYRF
jgi:hypothetical protein